jgi:hypothetical protein
MQEMDNPASLRCAENIALFHMLHAGRKDGTLCKDSVPARPAVGTSGALPTHHEDYALSFDRERSLAGALAFISYTKDDPNHIPAVCIEENYWLRAKPLLWILLAVNRSERKDGNDILRSITAGLQRIFALLSQVVDGSKCPFSRECSANAEFYGIQQTMIK